MKTINLPIETAKEMYTSSITSLVSLALANYTKEELEAKELPKTLTELGKIRGYYVDNFSNIVFYYNITAEESNTNTFATREQAQASLALAQLSQLMKVYNDGWVPDWLNNNQNKYCIYFHNDKSQISIPVTTQRFIILKSQELAQQFFENFKDLIEQAKPLL